MIPGIASYSCIFLIAAQGAMAGGAEPAAAGRSFDLQGFVDLQLQAGVRRVVIPPGRYRVTSHDRQHLVLKGLRDVELVADGVEMICTETTRALTVADCARVTLRGLVIDYDPLPFSQGQITAVSPDRTVAEIRLFDGYPAAASVRNFKYEVFRPDTRTLRCDDRYPSAVEVLDERRLRVTCRAGRVSEQVGDLIVIGAESAPHGSIPHAVECSHNVDVRLENITLFASNCFGFLETDCDGSVYQRCRIVRRDPADDPVRRASPRLRSLNADAFHSKHAIKGPSYLGCAASFMGDDCINICGDYHLIMGGQGGEFRVLAKGGMNIRPGDPVEMVRYTGERLPDAKTVSVEPAGTIRDDERAFLREQAMNEQLKSGRGLERAFTVTLDRSVDLARGAVLCAANRVGSGFVVRDCRFGFNRSRGILIKASNGVVSGNRLEGCLMSAILVSPEYWWLEAGSSNDLEISGNTITGCGGIPIRIEAKGGNGLTAPAGAHRDLTVIGNTITGCAMPGMRVTSTAGLRLRDNRMDQWIEPDGSTGPSERQPVVKINCTE